jgi:PKD repeat protein
LSLLSKGGAFVPAGVWPEEFDGAYLYGDFVFGEMYLMKDAGTPEYRTCNPPSSNKDVSDFTEFGQIVNMGFGPYGNTQALYYSGVLEIRRVTYVGDGNRSPYAIILAEPTSGQVGVEVMFSGAGSTDPDGDGLSFEWDFDGDGVVDLRSQIPPISTVRLVFTM